jgi:hypothetical protein
MHTPVRLSVLREDSVDYLPACICGWAGARYVESVEAQGQQEDHEFAAAAGLTDEYQRGGER